MNGARLISDSLKSLHEQLELVEIRMDNEYSQLDRRENSNSKTTDRLEEVFHKQTEILFFNISGKLIPVDKCIIIECEYENILTQMCKNIISQINSESVSQINQQLSDIMIDRNRKNFRCVIDLMRKHDDVKKGRIPSQSRIPYHVPRKAINPVILKEDLAFYFKGQSYDRIFEDFIITYSDFISESSEIIKMMYSANTTVNYFLKDFEVTARYPDERLELFKAETIDDIKTLDSFKAIFSDFDSNIIFNFADVVKCKMIELRPFWGDFEMWYPGNGADSNIYSSVDGVNWELLSTVPPDYGFDIEMLHFVEFEPRDLKHVKFEAKNIALSISYIKFS
jgi:hypothetical protein